MVSPELINFIVHPVSEGPFIDKYSKTTANIELIINSQTV